MVALVVKLRWRQFFHQLGRNVWMIVALAISAMMALGLLAILGFGLGALRVFAPDIAASVLVIAGTVIVLGWWIGSVLVSGDDLLAPERFALLPVRARKLLPGLTLAGATTIGGIGTTLALLLMLIGWSVNPLALVAGILTVPLALMLCVLGARVVSGLLAGWLAHRRTRDILVIVGVMLIACSGVLLNVVMGVFMAAEFNGEAVATVAEISAWTPFGAIFGVPAALVDGSWVTAALRLLIALATIAVLWIVAERLLAARLCAPILSSGGGNVRSGGVIDRMLPPTPTGAIAARTMRLMRRDPRRIVNLAMLLVLPAILLGVNVMNGLGSGAIEFGPATVLVPAIAALLICSIIQMDIAYDNDAIALHVHTGVSGTADRAGRLLGFGVIALPLLVVLCVLSCALSGQWELLPASLGVTLGMSIIAAGAGAWVGAFMPGRAPAPEANPLGRGSSGGAQSMVALLIMAPVTFVAGAPALGFAIAAMVTGNALFSWISLAVGLLVGVAAVWGGSVLGGRILDRRWPEVLTSVASEG